MQSKGLYPSQSTGLNKVYMEFELLGAGASAPTIPAGGDGKLWVASITRTSAGFYVVTMKDAWNKVITKSAEPDDTLNDGAYATIGGITNEGTASALVFNLFTRNAGGTNTDLAAARRLGVTLVLRNGVQTVGL